MRAHTHTPTHLHNLLHYHVHINEMKSHQNCAFVVVVAVVKSTSSFLCIYVIQSINVLDFILPLPEISSWVLCMCLCDDRLCVCLTVCVRV